MLEVEIKDGNFKKQENPKIKENTNNLYSDWDKYEVTDEESEDNNFTRGRHNFGNTSDNYKKGYRERKRNFQATNELPNEIIEKSEEKIEENNQERKYKKKSILEDKKEDLLELPENAISLAEYKKQKLLSKNKSSEVKVNTNFKNENQKDPKKDKASKVYTKRDNELEEKMNEIISKKIIQSVEQPYDQNENGKKYNANKYQNADKYNSYQTYYQDENNYRQRNNYNYQNSENNQFNYRQQYSKAGNFYENKNQLKNVIQFFYFDKYLF